MLFFVDETWQDVGGESVGALGAVALKQTAYNRFARDVYSLKRDVVGAREMSDRELGGNRCLSRRQFTRRDAGLESQWLDSVDGLFEILARHHARIFVVWTTNPSLLTLRNPNTTALTKPYKRMMFDFRALMEREAPKRLAMTNFDQRGTKEDSATACAISNYFYRTQGGWADHFILVPNFTVSAASPGLQAADIVAYLGAHCSNRRARPELAPLVARLQGLQYEYDGGDRTCRTIRWVT